MNKFTAFLILVIIAAFSLLLGSLIGPIFSYHQWMRSSNCHVIMYSDNKTLKLTEMVNVLQCADDLDYYLKAGYNLTHQTSYAVTDRCYGYGNCYNKYEGTYILEKKN